MPPSMKAEFVFLKESFPSPPARSLLLCLNDAKRDRMPIRMANKHDYQNAELFAQEPELILSRHFDLRKRELGGFTWDF